MRPSRRSSSSSSLRKASPRTWFVKNLPLRSRTMREIAVCVPTEQVARKSVANDAVGKGIKMEAAFATAAPSSPTCIMMLQSVSAQCVHTLARCQWHHWQKIAGKRSV